MHTLILNGSPRKQGDTAYLIDLLRSRLKGESTQIDAFTCGVSPCIDCRYCREHPGCAIPDGMQSLYPLLERADALIIASPLYFSELTGPLLSLCSRMQPYYTARIFRKENTNLTCKRGGILLTGGGDGAPDRALATARMLLRLANVREIYDPILFLNTDRRAISSDKSLPPQVEALAGWLNREG